MALQPTTAARKALYDSWHARLLARQSGAREALATMLLEDLGRLVVDKRADAEALGGAIDAVVQSYLDHPARYDPRRGYLPFYLAQAVRRDLKNLWRHEDVVHRAEAGAWREREPRLIQPGEETDDSWARLDDLLGITCSAVERTLLEAWFADRPIPELAALIGLDAAAPEARGQTFGNGQVNGGVEWRR